MVSDDDWQISVARRNVEWDYKTARVVTPYALFTVTTLNNEAHPALETIKREWEVGRNLRHCVKLFTRHDAIRRSKARNSSPQDLRRSCT